MEGRGGERDVLVRETFLSVLRGQVGECRFATWFEGGGSIEIRSRNCSGPAEARVVTKSAFEQGLFRKQFSQDLTAVAEKTLGQDARVVFAVSPDAAPPITSERVVKTRRHEARADAAPKPVDEPTPVARDGWVSGPSNAAATRLCVRVASGAPSPSPVLLWGPSGVGKSHLLQKLAEGFRRRRRRCVLASGEQYLRGFVEAVRSGDFAAFHQRYAACDALLLDDVQHLIGKRKTLEEIRQTIDSLSDAGAQVVLAADRGLSELRGLGPELTSRIAGGLPVEIEMPDAAMRKDLAVQAARRLGVELPEEAAAVLAGRLLGGGREIAGAINRLVLMHETFGRPIDAGLAARVADDTNRLSTPPVRLDDIQRAVCGVFGVDAKTLRSDKRTKAVTEPRMLAMFLARKMTGSAWSEIGDFFGRRSHSTVIAAHRRVEQILAAPPTAGGPAGGELGESLRRVEAALRSA